jgi:LPS-assembly protein
MNKAYYLLIAVLSTFAAHTAMAEDAVPSGASFEYSFKPLSWYPLEDLTAEEKADLPSFCTGKYRPVSLVPREDESILIEANESSIDKNGDALLLGDVEFSQLNRKIFSDQAVWSQQERSAEFNGNVTIINSEMVMTGDYAHISESNQTAELENSEYSIPKSHIRGSAASIDSSGQAYISLEDATYTFCEPNQNDWDIKASEIILDRENGIGSAWHARLRIKEFPVMYFPYYRFPIDDRRMTGFLDPIISINGEVQADEISTPFYINLHPQADATITPTKLLDRGLLWETQFRHLTSIFGYGELNYGILKEDDLYLQDEDTDYDKEDRWSMNYQQSGKITDNWNHRWQYNRVSDNDYFNDMSPSATINRDTHLPTRGEIYFDKSAWHFDLTGESYQTIDDTIDLSDRPYQRIPQLNLTYNPEAITGFSTEFVAQLTKFERDNTDLTEIDAVNGSRLVLDSSISYTFEWPFAYITPKAEYKIRQYDFTDIDQTLLDDDFEENPSYAVPKYSVDAAMYFERPVSLFNNAFTQTLEPRIMHLQVPYYDQSDIPDFDSSELTFNYSQLFRDYRFNGNDRIGDTNQTTLGLTTRFLRDSDGTEQFNASIGQIFYHEDRQVQLDEDSSDEENLTKSSSIIVESNWSPYEEWDLYSMVEWGKDTDDSSEDSGDEILQKQFTIEYNDGMNHMMNFGLRESKDSEIRQLDVGAFWALNDSWALIGSRSMDLWNYADDELEPVDTVTEALVGFEYQSCCWNTRLLYQEQTKRITSTDASTDKTYGILLQFELKGLGTIGGDPETTMSESIRGYSTRRYFDFESE